MFTQSALSRSLTFSIYLLFIARSSAQSTCSNTTPNPIKLPVQNVTFDSNIIRWGVAMSIGTPAQDISLAVNVAANNTYIYDQTGECPSDMSTAQCIGGNGGAFDEKQSSTWVMEPLSDDVVEDPLFSVDSSNNLGDEFGTDTLHLTDSTSVSRFPFHIPRFSDDSTVHRNNLGLGPESTLLSQLHKAGKIASRSWSLFWGLTGPTAQMDGNLILGGYDAAKVQGAEYTQPILRNGQCASGLLVTVTNIMMNVDGTSTDVLDSSPMQMCIRTDYELITIPNAVWSNMGFSFCENRAVGLNLWGCDFPTDQIYTGDLQFILNNSVVITIPNSQLVQTDNGFDPAGNLVYNNSVRELMLNALESVNANDMPLLGMTFLSSAYLSINYDQAEFTLWQANPTTDENILAIDSTGNGCTPVASPVVSPVASPVAASSTTSNSADSHKSSSSFPVGAIAGIVVGVVVLIMVGAAFWFCRSPRQRRKRWNEQQRGAYPMDTYRDKAELSADEMPTMTLTTPPWGNSNHDRNLTYKQDGGEMHELPGGEQ